MIFEIAIYIKYACVSVLLARFLSPPFEKNGTQKNVPFFQCFLGCARQAKIAKKIIYAFVKRNANLLVKAIRSVHIVPRLALI